MSAAGTIGDNTFGESVVGRNIGESGVGAVVGRNGGVGGYGVRGFATNDDSIGVFGQHGTTGHVNGFGVRGDISTTAGTGIGVFGYAAGASQYAVWAQGRSMATGTKSFIIDYPGDPTNKLLLHYSTEGSQPLNAYSGNVTTDANGSAWVTLPPYVEEINRDFRYQLTAIGDFSQVIVGKKIAAGKFQIRSSKPGIEVSWRVEGVRNDRFVEANGAPDVIEKPANWKGKYLNPELFDVPENKGIFFLPPANVPLLSDQPAKVGSIRASGNGATQTKGKR